MQWESRAGWMKYGGQEAWAGLRQLRQQTVTGYSGC